jgi:hypothetical protein
MELWLLVRLRLVATLKHRAAESFARDANAPHADISVRWTCTPRTTTAFAQPRSAQATFINLTKSKRSLRVRAYDYVRAQNDCNM